MIHRDDRRVVEEKDFHRLVSPPAQACKFELDQLQEWAQQEADAVANDASWLGPIAKSSEIRERVSQVEQRARAINLKDLPQCITAVESAIKFVKEKKYNHILEVPSILEREMIPLRNLARELYYMRETINLLLDGNIEDDDEDDC